MSVTTTQVQYHPNPPSCEARFPSSDGRNHAFTTSGHDQEPVLASQLPPTSVPTDLFGFFPHSPGPIFHWTCTSPEFSAHEGGEGDGERMFPVLDAFSSKPGSASPSLRVPTRPRHMTIQPKIYWPCSTRPTHSTPRNHPNLPFRPMTLSNTSPKPLHRSSQIVTKDDLSSARNTVSLLMASRRRTC